MLKNSIFNNFYLICKHKELLLKINLFFSTTTYSLHNLSTSSARRLAAGMAVAQPPPGKADV